MGTSTVVEDKLQQLQVESDEYGDMVLLPTVTDSLFTLTQRTLDGFKYALEHYKFEFVLKCDDDTFVDVLRIASELYSEHSNGHLYWGMFRGQGKPLFFGTYRETRWSTCNKYLPYAFGGGYVLSRDIVELMVENGPYLMQYKCEDVAVGAWVSPYNVLRKHDTRFNTAAYSRGCKSPYLISHKVSTKDMYTLQESLKNEGTFCSWKTYFHRYHGYLYDWVAPTSHCCLPNDNIP